MTEDEPLLPPPHDLEAERALIRGVLDSQIRAGDTGLSPDVFFLPLHRVIWACLLSLEELSPSSKAQIRASGSALPWLARIVGKLDPGAFEGAANEVAYRYLLELRVLPVQVMWDIWQAGRRIVELARQRQLLEAMARIEGAWRSGQEASPELLRWTGRRLMRMACCPE